SSGVGVIAGWAALSGATPHEPPPRCARQQQLQLVSQVRFGDAVNLQTRLPESAHVQHGRILRNFVPRLNGFYQQLSAGQKTLTLEAYGFDHLAAIGPEQRRPGMDVPAYQQPVEQGSTIAEQQPVARHTFDAAARMVGGSSDNINLVNLHVRQNLGDGVEMIGSVKVSCD